jgi:hypothetical protein
MGKSGGRFLPAALDAIGTHTPTSVAALLWHKIDNVWHWYEIPNMVSFYYMRRLAPVLAWLPVTFYLVAPLALVGLVAGWRHRREAWPLYALAACLFVSLAGFLVLGRLRAAMMAAVIPFAALAVATCIRGRTAARLAILASAAALLLWTGRPLPAGVPLIPVSDWLTPFAVEYQDRIKRALDAGDRASAAAAYADFLRYEPPFSEMPTSGSVLVNDADRELARTFAQTHAVVSELLRGLGRTADAQAHIQRATALLELAGISVRT